MWLAATTLNHILAQNTWALQRLQPLSGKSFTIQTPPLPALTFTLQPDGCVIEAPQAIADATLNATADALLRYFAVEPRDPSLIRITGDAAFGAEIGHVLAHIHWEVEEDLSRLLGDIIAHRVVGFGRNLWEWRKQSTLNLATAVGEYFTEEQAFIIRRRHVEQFAQEVEVVRAATDQLDIRIQKLVNRG